MTRIDDDEFTAVTIDGEDVAVITVDGEVVWIRYPLVIEDFDGGTIREEWGNRENHATTSALSHTGSHAGYRVDGSSLYDDGTRFADRFQDGGRFIVWSFYISELGDWTQFQLGFNAEGPPAPENYNTLVADASSNELYLREYIDGELTLKETVDAPMSTGEWYEFVAWWGHGLIECWIYDESGEQVGHLQADDNQFYGDYWWIYDPDEGDGTVIDNIRLYETHPYTGRHYTEAPTTGDFEEQENDIVISPTGSDSEGDGSYENPYYTLNEAFEEVSAGQRVICRGGTYEYTERQLVSNVNGTESDPIILRPYGDEWPVFDFSTGNDVIQGLSFYDCDWWEIRDVEVKNVPNSDQHSGDGLRLWGGSSNTVIDGVESHDNTNDGFEIVSTYNCTVRNCKSYRNVGNPGGSDGMQVRDEAEGLVIEHCQFYDNADDGIDLFNATNGDQVTIRYCAAWGNGVQPESDPDAYNGNFKLGANQEGTGGHLVHHCAAWDGQTGFLYNRAYLPLTLYNCVAYDHQSVDFNFSESSDYLGDPDDEHVLRNCMSVTNEVWIDPDGTDDDYCTWTEGISQSEMDIRSLDPEDFSMWGEEGDFLRLGSSSTCIDAGTTVGLEYEGEAPDIAGYERGHPDHDPVEETEEPPETGYHVSPDGDDSNPGTYDEPWRTVFHALEQMADMDATGETLHVHEGTYNESDSGTLWVEITGSEDNPVRIKGYGQPVINLSGVGTDYFSGAIHFYACQHLVVEGLIFEESPGDGIRAVNQCINLEIRDCISRFNQNTGIRLNPWNGAPEDAVVVRNCEAYANARDPIDENETAHADGFAVGPDHDYGSVVFIGCVAHHNEDDGFDTHFANGDTFIRCIAYRNGYDLNEEQWRPNDPAGDGWKLGSPTDSRGPVYLYECVAWDNEKRAFLVNSNPYEIIWHNCTVYNMASDTLGDANWADWDSGDGREIRNCISVHKDDNHMNDPDLFDDQYNTWNLGISDPQFQTEDPDNELFLHLTEESPCIDAGIDVGRDYGGDQPDLGAYDFILHTQPLLED